MRARSLKKRERELRGQLLDAASRLLSTAEKQAGEGRPHLLRTIVAIATSTSSSEAAKKRLELTEDALEVKVELEQIKLDERRGGSQVAHVDVDLGDLPRPKRNPPAGDAGVAGSGQTPENPTET